MCGVMMAVQSIYPAKQRGIKDSFHACGCKKAKLDYILKKLGPHSSSLTIRNRPNKNRLPDKCQLTRRETIFCLALTQFKR